MEDKQDNWEKFLNLTDGYQPDPEIANRVIEKINQRENTVTFRKPLLTKKFAIILWCFLFTVGAFLAVFFPVYCKGSKPDITLYTLENIEFEGIDNMNDFVETNNYDISYFNTDLVNNRVAKIKSNSKIGYISQNTVFIGESGIDKILLQIIVLPDSSFEFCKQYESLEHVIDIDNLTISYSKNDDIGSTGYKYKAKFNLKNYDYYLELETPETETAVLEKYINILIN